MDRRNSLNVKNRCKDEQIQCFPITVHVQLHAPPCKSPSEHFTSPPSATQERVRQSGSSGTVKRRELSIRALQRSPLFCTNIVKKDPGRARQSSLATAETNFTKPGAQNKGDPCIIWLSVAVVGDSQIISGCTRHLCGGCQYYIEWWMDILMLFWHLDMGDVKGTRGQYKSGSTNMAVQIWLYKCWTWATSPHSEDIAPLRSTTTESTT